MIDYLVFYDRFNTHCKPCPHFQGSKCRKGHSLASPNGCPIQKFPPLDGASYDMDQEPDPMLEPTCAGCTAVNHNMPDMTWPQVIQHFTSSMIRWAAAGMPLVSDTEHAQRQQTCQACPRRKNHWCSICHCLIYLKSKVRTESCPEYRWLR
jgi:hypothetical protein